jgi:D-glycero-D-manno-heptose 1,7-bisphosphate phosphatase
VEPAVFLDRDGTLIEWVPYLVDASRVRLIEGAGQAIRRLKDAGYRCVVVTNQSVIGRGLCDEAGLAAIHATMHQQLAELGCHLDGLYFCPVAPRGEAPDRVEHPDRKPGPGLLQRAAAELQLDLARSWMIGDSLSDLLAGRNAGCRGGVLVRTGKGAQVDPSHPAVDRVAADLPEAAEWILRSASAMEAPPGALRPAGRSR